MDLDDNNYPDLLVGAYDSGKHMCGCVVIVNQSYHHRVLDFIHKNIDQMPDIFNPRSRGSHEISSCGPHDSFHQL